MYFIDVILPIPIKQAFTYTVNVHEAHFLKPGHRVLIDNGLVEGRVVSRRGGKVRVKITLGGPVSTRKGLNLPDSDLPFEISKKDRLDIRMAVEEASDLSFVPKVFRTRQ